MNSNELFTNSSMSIDHVFRVVFQVLFANFKPLVSIALLQLLSIAVAVMALAGMSFLLFAETLSKIMEILPNMDSDSGGFGRRLLIDYAVGFSGTSHLLERNLDGYYGEENNEYDDEIASDISSMIFEIIILALMWMILISIAASTFSGAITHNIADFYAGGSPTVSKSIQFGWSKKWSIFCFMVAFGSAVFLGYIFIALFTLALIGGRLGGFLYVIFFISFLVVVSAVAVGGIPTVVVEGLSPISAIKRSWALCKPHICYLFCANFLFQILLVLATVIINLIFSKAPLVIVLLSHLAVNSVTMLLGPILHFALYMTIRISTEAVTQTKLAEELDALPFVHTYEMTGIQKESTPIQAEVV